MFERRPSVRLLALICVTLLIGRIGEAHLHFCLDGQEPSASLHLFDSVVHHSSAGAMTVHDDTDVAITAEPLAKKKFDWTPLLAALAALVVFAGALRTYRVRGPACAAPAAPAFERPPLRGPPC